MPPAATWCIASSTTSSARASSADASKAAYIEEAERLRREEAADSIIMGCTEITMLIGQRDFDIPVFDTTRIHAEAAVEFALG